MSSRGKKHKNTLFGSAGVLAFCLRRKVLEQISPIATLATCCKLLQRDQIGWLKLEKEWKLKGLGMWNAVRSLGGVCVMPEVESSRK